MNIFKPFKRKKIVEDSQNSNFIEEIKNITKWFKKNYFLLYLLISMFGPFGLMYVSPFYGCVLSCLLIICTFLLTPALIINLGFLQYYGLDLSNIINMIKTYFPMYSNTFVSQTILYVSILLIIGIYIFSFIIGTKKINTDNKKLYEYILAFCEWKNLKKEIVELKNNKEFLDLLKEGKDIKDDEDVDPNDEEEKQ